MKINGGKIIFYLITFGTLISMVSVSQAAELVYQPAKEHDAMLTTGGILQHNNRLLTYTTIGTALKNSDSIKARTLFKEAERLYKEAEFAYKVGQEVRAKELAFKSIAMFYESDKAHYGMDQVRLD